MKQFYGYASLTYSDRNIFDTVFPQHQEEVAANRNNFNLLLDSAYLPQDTRRKLQDLFAWLLYFNDKANAAQSSHHFSFNSQAPFTSSIHWPNVERFVIENISRGVEFGCDKEIFLEDLRTMVLQADQNAWQQFDLEKKLRLLQHTPSFNHWPAEIKRLAMFTLNVNSESAVANFSDANLSGLDLSGIDVSYANFSNANLEGVNFSGATCNGSNFSNANLVRANLNEVVGFSACFKNANLNKAILTEADFYNADFTGANLHAAHLERANLAEATLESVAARNAQFSDANLNKVDALKGDFCHAVFDRADLTEALLIHVVARNAQFSDANLSTVDALCGDFCHAVFDRADLTEAIFTQAELDKAHLLHAQMEDARFDGATFQSAVLIGSSLRNADLEGAKLELADLEGADLTGANLSDATFHNANLTGANVLDVDCDGTEFSGAIFGDQLRLDFSEDIFYRDLLTDEMLDRHFNHLDNHASTLLSIDSISNQYQTQKIELVGKMIRQVHEAQRAGIDLSGVVASLADFLFTREMYHSHPAISTFLTTWLMPDRVKHWERVPLGDISNPHAMTMLSRHLLREVDQPHWFLSHQGFINQVLVFFHTKAEAFEGATLDLYNELKANVHHDPLIKQVCATEVAHLFTGDEYFFVHPNGLQVFVCDEKLLAPIITNPRCENEMPMPLWSAHWFFTRSNLNENFNLTKIDGALDEVLHPYPLLAHSYAASDPKGIRADFIRLVLPSPTDVAMAELAETKDYGKLFLDACQLSTVGDSVKLTSIAEQTALSEKFAAFFSTPEPPTITTLHAEQLWGNFLKKNAHIDDTAYHRATLFFSLGAFYVHASSSQIFGEELDSPQILRFYASALLREAYSLAPHFFGDHQESAAQVYDEWQDQLLGRNGGFTCTAVLSEKMINHIDAKSLSNSTVEKILTDVYPIAWR